MEDYQKLTDDGTTSVYSTTTTPIGFESTGNLLPSVTGTNQRKLKHWSKVKVLAACQLFCGVFILVCWCIVMGISASNRFMYGDGFEGTGIWGGVLFIISGAFGLAAHVRPFSQCRVVAHMVLSIISAIVAVLVVIMSAYHSVIVLNRGYYPYPYPYYAAERNAEYGLFVTTCVLAACNIIVCIVSSSLMCCNAYCCTGKKDNVAAVFVAVPNIGTVLQQKVILVPVDSSGQPLLPADLQKSISG